MIRLALTSVRHRLAAVLATFLAVVIGTGLVIACGGVLETAIRLDAPPQRLDGAPVVVAGPGEYEFADHSESIALPERPTLDPALLPRVAAVPGVARAVGDATFPAVPLGPDGPVTRGAEPATGHAWSAAALTPYTLTGRAPAAADEVVLDADTAAAAGARAGDRIQVAVDGTPATYLVTGLARADRPVNAAALFFADARGHAPNVLGVYPAPGTSATALADTLRQALPADVTVRTGDERGGAEFVGVAGSRLPLFILAGAFGGLLVVMMAIVVAATTTLSIRRRHRELALLRATGATPGQARKLVMTEALVVAALGAVAGAVLGLVTGGTMADQLRSRQVIPAGLEFHQGPLTYAAGVLIALGAVWLSTRLAARPAERVSAIEALREAALPEVRVHPLRRVLAAILAIGTAGLAVATMFMSPADSSALGGPAVLTGAIAVALVGPLVVRRVANRYGRAQRTATGRLATVNLRVRAVQYGAVLTPITIATSIALGNIYAQTTQDDAARAAYLDRLQADVVVTGGVPAGTAERLSRLPGVRGASELVTSQGWLEKPFDDAHTSDPLRLIGLSRPTGDPVYTGDVRDGTLADLRPGTVALPLTLAENLGVHPRDRVTVRLGDGARIEAEVVALLEQPSGYEQLVLPAEVLAAHTTGRLAPDLLLRTADPATVAAEVRRELPAAAAVGGTELLRAEFDAGLGVQASINYLIAALALAYAALATINTLAVAILDRRREFGLQRLTGTTRREVTRMLYREVGLVGVLGYGTGAIIAALTVWPIAVSSGQLLPSGPLWVLLASAALVGLLLVPVTAITARLAMRQPAAAAVAT
ncbi:ABC transporter permease [Amycolatopsis samaneae]|uniref:FtsX-like permease family protein n=1 Tax=Amycolatopsis samaneae TaxID=664691 RepID=A0ABW5G7N3_9PSEU